MKVYYKMPTSEGYFYTIIQNEKMLSTKDMFLDFCKKSHHTHHTKAYEIFLKESDEKDYENDFKLDYIRSLPLRTSVQSAVNDNKMISIILEKLKLDLNSCKNLDLYFSESLSEIGLFEDEYNYYFYVIEIWT